MPHSRTPAETTPPEAASPAEHPARTRQRWWKRRPYRIALLVCGLAVPLIALAIRSPSPIGHWDSAEGQDRFLQAYDRAFEDMPRIAETIDVRTDFGVVRLYRFDGRGTGTPAVLLPGRSSASPVWADNLPLLLEISDVYTVDLLGEPGMSIQQRPIRSDEDQAEWLHQTLAALPEREFHLIGLSIGGWTAVNLARHRPDHIQAMTLIDPVYVFDNMPLGTIVRSIPAAMSWLPKSWRDSFNSYTAGGAQVEDVPVAEMIEAGMQHYRLRLPQPTRISEEQLRTLEMPILAIIAGDSVMLDPVAAVETAERALPDAIVRLYPGASHAVNGERPDEIAADIAEFLEGSR